MATSTPTNLPRGIESKLGAAVAGLVIRPMINIVGLKNLILAWVACLFVVIVLVWLVQREFGHERQSSMAPALAGGSSPWLVQVAEVRPQ